MYIQKNLDFFTFNLTHLTIEHTEYKSPTLRKYHIQMTTIPL